MPSRRHRSSEWGLLLPTALVAPRLKVLYLPTTKVACTALKYLLAEAEGSLDPGAIDTTPEPVVTRAHAIHDRRVSGLRLFSQYSEREQDEMLRSDEWWRVGALRDPYARMYSSWENRIFLRAPSHYIRSFAPFLDQLVDIDGNVDSASRVDARIEIVGSFLSFMESITNEPTLVNGDDHFRTQSWALRPGVVSLTHRLRVDSEGELASFADQLSRRADTALVLRRLNEGLGFKSNEVITARAAHLIESWFAEDFRNFGFPIIVHPESQQPLLLTSRESKLVRYVREVSERLDLGAAEIHRRSGARYGLREVGRRLAGLGR